MVLASGSPRRVALVRDAGFEVVVQPADIDDASIRLGRVHAADAATALAYFKARRVVEQRRAAGEPPCWVLAADTVCERDGEILGKPVDRVHAREMIRSLADRGHGVVTGWCLLGPAGERRMGRDVAWIEIGTLPVDDFERFLVEGRWEGKAGGYNLPEVVARGWPIVCRGDPETVVGLPIGRLKPLIARARGARR